MGSALLVQEALEPALRQGERAGRHQDIAQEQATVQVSEGEEVAQQDESPTPGSIFGIGLCAEELEATNEQDGGEGEVARRDDARITLHFRIPFIAGAASY
jgi:hypothetical protein